VSEVRTRAEREDATSGAALTAQVDLPSDPLDIPGQGELDEPLSESSVLLASPASRRLRVPTRELLQHGHVLIDLREKLFVRCAGYMCEIPRLEPLL
jgi:hypothetical protein